MMPHTLLKPGVVASTVVMLSARYQCSCDAREVITINVVMDAHSPDTKARDVIAALVEDIAFEVDQHSESKSGTVVFEATLRAGLKRWSNQRAFTLPVLYAEEEVFMVWKELQRVIK